MANQLSVLLNHIVSVFEADPLVNTILFVDDDTLDNEKENIYPLVVIKLLPSPKPEQDLRAYTLSIEVLNQRDDVKYVPNQIIVILPIFDQTFDLTFN